MSQQRNHAGSSGLMGPINNFLERWIPSAMTFAMALTIIVALMALLMTDTAPTDIVRYWGNGLSGILAFMTQMCLILLLGHILANTGPIRKVLIALARVPSRPAVAYMFVFVISAVLCYFVWGLGLIAGAVLAREVAVQGRARGIKLHFPLLVAAGYSGFIVWHMGYSGSGPLTAATEGSFLSAALGGGTIPVSETIFTWWNTAAVILVIIVCAALFWLVSPKDESRVYELPANVGSEEHDEAKYEVVTPGDRMDASRILVFIFGLALLAYLIIHFSRGGSITLDIVNWSLLTLVLLFTKNVFELIHLTKNAASSVGEILLQFPLYAGILGIMQHTGLIALFSDAFVSISTQQTFGVLAFLSAGIVNFFVPSGGGQFAVQGPIMLNAAQQLNVDPSIAIMAVAYGDQWTNMLQPFWALPILAIAGLKMRDILGYTTVTLIGSGVVMMGALWIASSV
ncbi:short-chain fatty acid transporter [Paracandidimonas soli]|uniref:Short-chain fatty acids transporter n=1 Tax=Paracandidimonas soli TaxID=1917182 RepID=A0A4R3VDF2_9BURK|nr:TIGR00366 family protein [Paracandidimonas soli]TCV00735.1 short-chain fatty acids transporter [Paracandidimonas soli]